MRDIKKLPDDAVLTFQEWCKLSTFSIATGVRLKKRGQGPIFTVLSKRRVGVTIRHHREWLASRECSGTVPCSAAHAAVPPAAKRKRVAANA